MKFNLKYSPLVSLSTSTLSNRSLQVDDNINRPLGLSKG